MKQIAWLLVAVLAVNTTGLAAQMDVPSATLQDRNPDLDQAVKVKAEVTQRGIGKQSRVRISLRDGTKIKGYISKVDESSFGLTNQKSGKVTTISYEDVSKVKRQGLSKPAKILIICGVVVGAMIAIGVAAACHVEGGPHC